MKITLTHLLIAFTLGLLLSSGILVQNAFAGQPHMVNALEDLRAARHELEIAEHNKGGYREQAIGTIDQAIAQVKAGMEEAR